jgi:Tfp pilus assembly protein PilO
MHTEKSVLKEAGVDNPLQVIPFQAAIWANTVAALRNLQDKCSELEERLAKLEQKVMEREEVEAGHVD